MKKTFKVVEACLAAYGTLAVIGSVLTVSDRIKDKKKKEQESDVVHKERGKTYFKVQNKNLGTKEPLGFHIQ